MTKLVMTRLECARLIDRFASDLRYQTAQVYDLAALEERDTEMEMTVELQLRQTIQTLVQLLQVMNDLT